MNFEVAREFEKALKRPSKKYPSLKNDYLDFLSDMEQNPTMGDEIFSGCRKARIEIRSKGKGKRGGGAGRDAKCKICYAESRILCYASQFCLSA